MILDDDSTHNEQQQQQQQQQPSGENRSSSSSLPSASSPEPAKEIDTGAHTSVRALRLAIQDRHLRSLLLSGNQEAAEKFALAVGKSLAAGGPGGTIGGGAGAITLARADAKSHDNTARSDAIVVNDDSEGRTSNTKISSSNINNEATSESILVQEEGKADEDKSDSSDSETLGAIVSKASSPPSSPARSFSHKSYKSQEGTTATDASTPSRRGKRWTSPTILQDDPDGTSSKYRSKQQQPSLSTQVQKSVDLKEKQDDDKILPSTITVRTFPPDDTEIKSSTIPTHNPKDSFLADDDDDDDIEKQRPSGNSTRNNSRGTKTKQAVRQDSSNGNDFNGKRFGIGVAIALLIAFAFLGGGLYWWYHSSQQ